MLLLYIRLDHLRGETSRQLGVLAALKQNADHYVRVAARSESNEPSVLREFVTVFVLRAEGKRNDLSRSRFTGDIDSRHVRRGRGTFRQQDTRHRVGDEIPSVWIDREALHVGEVSRFHETGRQVIGVGYMGDHHTAAHRDCTDRAQELYRGYRNGALTDADRDGFPGEPLLL